MDRLGRVTRTIIQIGLIAIVLGGTLFGGYWLLFNYLRLPFFLVMTVIGGSAVLLLATAVYSYYIGYVRYWEAGTPDAAKRIESFRRRFRLCVFGALSVLPLLLTVASIFQNVTVGLLLLAISLITCPWALRKIARERRRPK
jgi:hypothetical protein